MAQPQVHDTPSKSQLEQVAQAVRDLLHQPEYDDGSAGPVLVRLAWHSAGTYCSATNTGGSNGAGMRYEKEGGDEANAGLQHARAFLEPIKKRFPFITMGFNDQEIVALSGAHNLGRCHSDRSGFEGKWVNNPTRFSNTYYKMLLVNDWKRKKLDNGKEQFVYVDEDLAEENEDGEASEEPEELMMLPTDIALIQDLSFRPWVELYAEHKDIFFDHFSKVFAKLLELGIRRDKNGNIVNEENQHDGYKSAPKKSDAATAAEKDQNKGQVGHEAKPLKDDNEKMRRRRQGAKL
ncbi:hypothetical protein LTR51_004900 [Lithohypha guttulata]|nr:hypothetical protein LTR51_004900 [Lithohypha guttulata]